jgi:hypothetical protein
MSTREDTSSSLLPESKKQARDVLAKHLEKAFGTVWPLTAADEVLSALESAGWAIVPVEPTEKMHKASWGNDGYGEEYWFEPRYPNEFTTFWQYMLTATKEG